VSTSICVISSIATTLLGICQVNIPDWDLDRHGDDGLGNITHAVEVKLAYRTKDHLYHADIQSAGTRSQAIELSIGEISIDNKFHPWEFDPVGHPCGIKHKCIQVDGDDLRAKLFFQHHWLEAWKDFIPDLYDDEPVADPNEHVNEARLLRYDFSVESECTMITQKRDKDTVVNVMLANFNLIRICNIYQFADTSMAPYYKILVRQIADPGGEGTVYLSTDDTNRQPDVVGFKFLDVEVLFQMPKLRNVTDIASLFSGFYPKLLICDLNLSHFHNLLNALKAPEPDLAITRFGRQPNGFFVGGNVCFKDGEYASHDTAGVAIMPQFFSDQDAAIHPSQYPRYVIIGYKQVRYSIAVQLYSSLMPAFFLNNVIPARAALALGVMGLHASKFWAGESGLGHGMPLGWLVSSCPGTGKTESALLVNSMEGYHHVPVWGGDPTKPALFDKLALQGDLTAVVDDVLIDPANPTSKPLATSTRTVFDGSTRAVSGKSRTPHSTAMFTSNGVLNEKDAAYQSRMLTIHFDELDASLVDEVNSGEIYANWLHARQLISACALDLETILFNGKLDKFAMQDSAQFVHALVGRKRDRNMNMCAAYSNMPTSISAPTVAPAVAAPIDPCAIARLESKPLIPLNAASEAIPITAPVVMAPTMPPPSGLIIISGRGTKFGIAVAATTTAVCVVFSATKFIHPPYEIISNKLWKFVRWGILLFYMLNLNAMMQCLDDNDAVVMWVVKLTASSADLSAQLNEFEEFVIAVHQIRADCGSLGTCNALGPMERTIFWHNLRTTVRPAGPLYAGKSYVALRLEPCCAVIGVVLNRSFSNRSILQLAKAREGVIAGDTVKAAFYHAEAGWPCVKSVYDESRCTHLQIPLEESELKSTMCKTQRCIFIENSCYEAIVRKKDPNFSNCVDATQIMVNSSLKEVGSYNFYNAVCDGSWFGFRSVGCSTFAEYCGVTNLLYVGSPVADVKFDPNVEALAEFDCDGRPLAQMYAFSEIVQHFNFSYKPESDMPIAYSRLAFLSRNEGDDTEISDGKSVYEGARGDYSHEDDEQTDQEARPLKPDSVASSSPLGDISNRKRQNETGGGRAAKKTRGPLVYDEAEGESGDDDDDDDKVLPHTHS